jgi:hypothetical protein
VESVDADTLAVNHAGDAIDRRRRFTGQFEDGEDDSAGAAPTGSPGTITGLEIGWAGAAASLEPLDFVAPERIDLLRSGAVAAAFREDDLAAEACSSFGAVAGVGDIAFSVAVPDAGGATGAVIASVAGAGEEAAAGPLAGAWAVPTRVAGAEGGTLVAELSGDFSDGAKNTYASTASTAATRTLAITSDDVEVFPSPSGMKPRRR